MIISKYIYLEPYINDKLIYYDSKDRSKFLIPISKHL